MALILAIDSEDQVRSAVIRVLQRAGHRVIAAAGLDEALDSVAVSNPDLALTNINLQGITGREAMKKLKAEYPKLSVLMVAGLPDEKLIRAWEKEENFDIFPEPFSPDSLVRKVRAILEGVD